MLDFYSNPPAPALRQLLLRLAKQSPPPFFLYQQAALRKRAEEVLAFPKAYGLTARYAVKANANRSLLKAFAGWGLHFEASSWYEVERLKRAGIALSKVFYTSQELPKQLKEWEKAPLLLNATSLHQIDRIGRSFGRRLGSMGGRRRQGRVQGRAISLRINWGLGSGQHKKTEVAGRHSSFGIWHEQMGAAKERAERWGLRVTHLHSHIGSGSEAEFWQTVARRSLAGAKRFPSVTTVSLGGGFKTRRRAGEQRADLQQIGAVVKQEFERFYREEGRRLRVEVEPGAYLTAEAGLLVAEVIEVTSNGRGYDFIKVNTGMNALLRPALYGAQHQLTLLPRSAAEVGEAEAERARGKAGRYVVVGHCCEGGDLLTPPTGKREEQRGGVRRDFPAVAVGDLMLIGGVGAYGAAMANNYNSYPLARELLLRETGSVKTIKRAQTLSEMVAAEV